MTAERKIIHIDMDAFYASIEQRDNSHLKGKPVVVGYSGTRGVVAAASYEARKFGVYSAMSSKVALRKCPYLNFVSPRFAVYKEVSNQIMQIFNQYTDMVEPLSLDEAFLDVTQNLQDIPYATTIAEKIKQDILQTTQLTASAGVSYNKFLAKIASDVNKPNGLFIITPKRATYFLKDLPVSKFFGVGKVTAEKMNRMGINTGEDLLKVSKEKLVAQFGRVGLAYYDFARGVDHRLVEPNRLRKSVGAENTFLEDIYEVEDLCRELKAIAIELSSRLQRNEFFGKTFTLKVRFSDFSVISRSKTFTINTVWDTNSLYEIGKELLSHVDCSIGVRLLGMSIKNSDYVSSDAFQLSFDFEDY